LLQHGANVNKGDYLGWTALHFASFHCHIELAKMLMAWGANLNANTFISFFLPIDVAKNEETKQAIREESNRRIVYGL
jgi:ankyrin repeat protein